MLVAGAVPAVVSARTAADPVLARSLASANAVLDYPAAPFRLTDQSGRSVSLTGLRGKVVLLAFLDPHCGSDCPPLAQEFGRVDQILGVAAKQIELVAIAASSGRSAVADTAAFTRRERLSQVQNWLFLTGSTSQLHEVWRNYAIAVPAPGPGTPAGHSDIALIIDPAGQVRSRLEDDQALWTQCGRGVVRFPACRHGDQCRIDLQAGTGACLGRSSRLPAWGRAVPVPAAARPACERFGDEVEEQPDPRGRLGAG